MLVMALFMVSMVPASFADSHMLDRKVMIYVKENAEKLTGMGLNKCVAHLSTEFQNVGKKAGTAYCKLVTKNKEVDVAQIIGKRKVDFLGNPIMKAKDRIEALNIETSKKELFMSKGISNKIYALSNEDAEKISKLKPNTIAKLKKLDRNQFKAILKKPLADQEIAITQAIEAKEAIKERLWLKDLFQD